MDTRCSKNMRLVTKSSRQDLNLFIKTIYITKGTSPDKFNIEIPHHHGDGRLCFVTVEDLDIKNQLLVIEVGDSSLVGHSWKVRYYKSKFRGVTVEIRIHQDYVRTYDISESEISDFKKVAPKQRAKSV